MISTRRPSVRPFLFLLALAATWGETSAASAQSATPDARNILPSVMMLVDTSGSMERLGQCACTTPGCAECLPTCSNNPVGTNERNRWATVVEAMTGTWPTYTCETQARPSGEPDSGYYLPHYAFTSAVQNGDGILDTYSTRVKFGLMTYDNVPTLRTQSALVPLPTYTAMTGLAATSDGDFSYGNTTDFELPGCAVPYGMNNGARNESALGYGRLYSPGADSSDPEVRALAIQNELLALRPYGATPTASMLADLEYMIDNHPDVAPRLSGGTTGDVYFNCRERYVILLTDGYPNADMRGAPYFCENSAAGGSCPVDEPEVIAHRLCNPAGTTCTGEVAGIFVVGFNVSGDADAVARLNLIAANGGTGQAYFADDLASLRTALATVLDQAAPGTTSRAVPALASTAATSSVALQSQFNAGFEIGDAGGPWSGVLERKRTQCNGTTPEEQRIDATDRFEDILNARSAATRAIYTVVPAAAANSTGYLYGTSNSIPSTGLGITSSGGNNGNNGQGGASCTPGGGNGGGGNGGGGNGGGNANGGGNGGGNGNNANPYAIAETNLVTTSFSTDNAALTAAHLGVGTETERQNVINWIRGNRGSVSKLGDIYHSSPVVVGRPEFNLPDESYNEFRRLPEVENRPSVLYVGTNDGMLHAFAAESITITAGPHAGRQIAAGEELWAFIPPVVLPRLKDATTSHQWMVDGTPYVRDVFFRRLPGQDPDGSLFHTVLIIPMGRGGGAYVALDVTDPLRNGGPKFLFQFSTSDMGATLGTPALAQVLVQVGTNLEERIIAMLPAGAAPPLGASTCGPQIDGDQWDSPLGCPSRGIGTPPLNAGTQNAVNNHRCWGTTGRHVYFVDPATGDVLQHLNDKVFNAPMTGGVGLYSGDTGTISTRAFMNDADGVLWRFDLSSKSPANWSAMQFADLFADLRNTYPNIGQPAYNPPVISTDAEGNLVVIQGTGNPDYLDGTAPNRVASYTENLTFDNSGNATVGLTTNWVLRMGQGEQLTGPIQLYNGVAYFSSFVSGVTSSDACALGSGRIYGVHYREGGGGSPVGRIETTTPGTYTTYVSAGTNQLVMGVTISQQLTCVGLGANPDLYDPYLMSNPNAQNVTGQGGGGFRLTALLSGGGAGSNGGSISEFTMDLPPPASYTRVNGWAGRVE